MASLRGSVGCEAFLGIPAHTCCSRDAPPCSAKLEHPVNILHRITDTLGGISVPSSVSMDLSFDCMTDSRGGIGSMEKLNSHLIEPADTKNHCQCSLRRCLGDTDMCGHHVIIVCLLQTRRGHLESMKYYFRKLKKRAGSKSHESRAWRNGSCVLCPIIPHRRCTRKKAVSN
jgi:hypothetical protein